jgi:pyruvate dehydrogenase E1 component
VPATILFSGTAHLAAREAAAELAEHYDVAAELWSATSYKALREEALAAERWNRLHPSQAPKVPRVAQILEPSRGPIVAVSDFMAVVPEQVQRFVPDRTFVPLGTDGMGRSDTREALRRHFEVDTGHVVLAVLDGLLADGAIDESALADAIERYDIDPDAVNPYWA